MISRDIQIYTVRGLYFRNGMGGERKEVRYDDEVTTYGIGDW